MPEGPPRKGLLSRWVIDGSREALEKEKRDAPYCGNWDIRESW